MLSRLLALFRRPAPSPLAVVVVTDTGFELRGGDGAAVAVAWGSVQRVLAYKRDLYAVDCIVLAFEHGAPPAALVEVAEDWPGFSDLFGAMERALGIVPSWYLEIMTPAFEPTPRLLFDRSGAADASR